AGSVLYIAVSDGTDTALVKADAEAGAADDAVIDTDDLTLVATFDGIGDAGTLTADNFTGFA
uniref:hypothetical protein n=1 Tax=Rhodosalinus sediminis TaxID=1940533 RepID=UPI002353BA22